MDEHLQLILKDACGISHSVFRGHGAIGFDRQVELVIIQLLTDARIVDLVGDLANRRIERVNRDQADRCVSRTVGDSGDIALAGVSRDFHVERRAIVEVANHEIRVHHLDVASDSDVACLHSGRAGSRELHALRAFAFHPQRNLLDVEDDVGDVFTHAGERAEFVQHILDLDRGDGRALQ